MKQQPKEQNNLQRERKKRGWTQGKVADRIGGHSKTVSRWERGLTTPSLYYQQKLAEIFEQSIEELGFSVELEERSEDNAQQNSLFQEDWNEAPSKEPFYGREEELAHLEQWIKKDGIGMISVAGIGGVGKTSLVMALVTKIRSSFSSVFWYSLRASPPFREFVDRYVRFLSPQQSVELPAEENDQVAYLVTYLQKQRVLLILDNFESVLQSGDYMGKYREGYEGYGLFLEQLGMRGHKSCLLLTSREKPREFARLQSSNSLARSLPLDGIPVADGRQILKQLGLTGPELTWNKLVELYSGNPLALKLIAGYVKEIFGGNIAAFLEAEKAVFGNIYDLLEQQFQRLSEQEQEIMYWLAIEHQPVMFEHFRENMVHLLGPRVLLEVLDSLRRRSLIETGYSGQYSLQSVVAEYVIENLTRQIYHELDTEALKLFRRVALMKAQERENVRNIQVRLVLMPVLAILKACYGEQGSENKLKRIITLLHTNYTRDDSYAASNLLHLLIQMQAGLRGTDWSSLVIRQAYLRGADLPAVNFSFANFVKSAFMDTFGCIYCVAFNANGSLFAAGMTNGEIRLWRTSPLEPLLTFEGHTDGIRSIAFSPNGRLLASGSHDQTVRIWDVATGNCQQILSGHRASIRSIAFHPDGQMLASGSEDRCIKIYQINTGQCIKELQGHTGWILTIAFSPDGHLLISAGDDGSIRLWEVDNGHCVDTLPAHTRRIRSVAYSPDGNFFASSGDDQVIKVWDARKRRFLHALEGPTFCVRSLAFSPNSRYLAAGGDDQMIYLWEVDTKRSLGTLQGHTNRIWSVAFHPENQGLLSGSEDQTVRLWDIKTGHCQHTLQGYHSLIWSVAFSPDSTLLSSGSEDGSCRIWETITGRCLKTLQGHTNRVRCTAFSPDGTILASSSDDLTIRLWDVSTAQCRNILRGHRHLVRSLAFHPNGHILVSGSHDKSIQLWDVHSGHSLGSLQGQNNLIWAVAFSPNGHLIASGSEDNTVRIWEVETRSCLTLLQGHDHRIWSVAFSPDGQFIASGSDDQTIRIWRVSDGRCVACLKGHTHWIRTLAFSPDGKTLVSGSHDMTIRLWEVSSGQCYTTCWGHQSWIWSVTFSSDGQTVASGSDDGTVKLWDRQTGKCLKTLRSERPYEGMNITGVKGLTEAQKMTLKALGACVDPE